MKLYEYKLTLKSPAIIVEKRTEKGYVKPMRIIPGSMVRGAILSALLLEGSISEEVIKKESEKPTLLASPAYPFINGCRALPGTPFTSECKKCGEIYDYTHEAVKSILTSLEPDAMVNCPKDGSILKSLLGSPILLANNRIIHAEIRTMRNTSVAINKSLGTSMMGMLFDYEAIAEGTQFWGRIAGPDWMEPGQIEIALGRGQSRGFGWAEFKLIPVEHKFKREFIYIAFSYLTPQKELEWNGCKIELNKAWGRMMKVQMGWDMYRGIPRPIINLAAPGSIVYIRVSCSDENNASAIFFGGIPVKLGDTWVTGVNVFLPLDNYRRLLMGDLE